MCTVNGMSTPIVGPPAPFPERPEALKKPRKAWPWWLIALVAAGAGLLIGGLAGTGGTLLVQQVRADRDYEVVVQLKDQLSEPEKAAVRARVDEVDSDRVVARSREENFQEFRKSNPGDPALQFLTAERFPESILFYTHGARFDCSTIAGLRDFPGVSAVNVHVPAAGDRLEGYLLCPR